MMKANGKKHDWVDGAVVMPVGRARTRRTVGRNGFTLIELIVVIGIMGIIFGVAVPAFYHFMPMFQLRSAARVLGSACQQARLKAASTTSEYRVCFNTSVRPYSVQIEKGNSPSGSTVWTPEGKNYWEIADSVDVSAVKVGTDPAPVINFQVIRPDGTTPAVAGYGLVFLPNGSTIAGNEFKAQITNAAGRQFEVLVSNTTGRVKVNDSWTP